MKKEKGDKMPPNFIIYDDLLGLLEKSRTMTNWFSVFRHTNTYIFLTSQYLNSQASSTLVRTQAKFIYAFRDRSTRTRKALYEWFGSLVETQEEFNKLFEQATAEKHRALIIITGQDSLEETFGQIKAASVIPPYKINFGAQSKDINIAADNKALQTKKLANTDPNQLLQEQKDKMALTDVGKQFNLF
jgi:hypothetical protein